MLNLLNPIVNGFFQIKHPETVKYFKTGDWLQFYVSKNDTEYDNVSIVNAANESFLFDFGGSTKKLSSTGENYHIPAIDKSEYTLLKVINPENIPVQEDPKPWWKFW